MKYAEKIKKGILLELLSMLILTGAFFQTQAAEQKTLSVTGDGYIKWVDFNVSYEALCLAYQIDVDTYGEPVHAGWIELLAYAAAKNGGEFKSRALDDIKKAKRLLCEEKKTMQEITQDLKYYNYYLEAYSAVLSGYVGEYEIETGSENEKPVYEKQYGLKAFSPIAKGFEYRDYDDFGVARSFGYKREHLGHDMMGQIGTPIRMLYQP